MIEQLDGHQVVSQGQPDTKAIVQGGQDTPYKAILLSTDCSEPGHTYKATLAHPWPMGNAVSVPAQGREATDATGSGGCHPLQTQGTHQSVTVGSSIRWPTSYSPSHQP